jgi:hypothetical protein
MWPFTSREDKLLEVLNKVLEQNNETQKAFLEATTRISEAAKQQGEVLARYLDLFKNPDPPRRWTSQHADQAELRKMLEADGYPVDGTEEEQAKWLAEQL